jgi:hypothetical protein
MGDRKGASDRKGRQPEALNTFGAAARSGSVKPKDQGLTAKSETAPKPKNLARKNEAAAEVLKDGATGQAKTNPAVKKASDR